MDNLHNINFGGNGPRVSGSRCGRCDKLHVSIRFPLGSLRRGEDGAIYVSLSADEAFEMANQVADVVLADDDLEEELSKTKSNLEGLLDL